MLGTRQKEGADDEAAGKNDRVSVSRQSPLPYSSQTAWTITPRPQLRAIDQHGLPLLVEAVLAGKPFGGPGCRYVIVGLRVGLGRVGEGLRLRTACLAV